MLTARRGSVMMEMIVVFPIYIVLFGGLFMLGDMLIKAARLPSAERTTAFDLGRESASESASEEGWNAVRNLLFTNSDTDDLRNEEPKPSEYYADTNIEGPFSLRAAVTVKNEYKMASRMARGQLQFADWFFARSTPNGAEMATGDNSMGDLINDGRVEMYSKTNSFDRTKITYNYYTLRRRRYNEGKVEDGGEGWTWRSNARPAADLMVENKGTQHWLDVADENWHRMVGNEPGNRDALKGLNGKRNNVEYTRYLKFEHWSN